MVERRQDPEPERIARGAPPRAQGRGGLRRARAAWWLAWLVCAAPACHLETTPSQSALMERANLSITGAELRVRVRALVGPYTGAIERVADEAARNCGNEPGVRANAIAWKLTAIPLAQDALLQPDPLVALLDGWAYAVQTRDFLRGEGGRAALGSCAPAAAATMQRICEREQEVAAQVAGRDVGRAAQLVESWAQSHPLASLTAPRSTVAEVLASSTARANLGALAAVGTIVETLDDLTVRIASYRQTLSKEARWTVELVAEQAMASDIAVRAAAAANRLASAAAQLGELAADIPKIVDRERAAAFAAVRAERVAILADVDRQRLDTLAQVRSEGQAIMERVDGTIRGAIDAAGEQSERIVDRAFTRAAELALALGLLIALVVVIAIVARRTLFSKHPRGKGPGVRVHHGLGRPV